MAWRLRKHQRYLVPLGFIPSEGKGNPIQMPGTVVYIHPKKRFAVLQLDSGVKICFAPDELEGRLLPWSRKGGVQ